VAIKEGVGKKLRRRIQKRRVKAGKNLEQDRWLGLKKASSRLSDWERASWRGKQEGKRSSAKEKNYDSRRAAGRQERAGYNRRTDASSG